MPSATWCPCRAILCLACVIVSAAAMACGARSEPARGALHASSGGTPRGPRERRGAASARGGERRFANDRRGGDCRRRGRRRGRRRRPTVSRTRTIGVRRSARSSTPWTTTMAVQTATPALSRSPWSRCPPLVFFQNDSASLDASAYEMIARIAWALRVSGDIELVAVIGARGRAEPARPRAGARACEERGRGAGLDGRRARATRRGGGGGHGTEGARPERRGPGAEPPRRVSHPPRMWSRGRSLGRAPQACGAARVDGWLSLERELERSEVPRPSYPPPLGRAIEMKPSGRVTRAGASAPRVVSAPTLRCDPRPRAPRGGLTARLEARDTFARSQIP